MNPKYRYISIVIFTMSSFCLVGQIRDSSFVELGRAFKIDLVNNEKPTLKSAFNYKTPKLPMFCKIEHYSDLVTPFQVRFRLGNLDYVNMLESK